MHVHESGTVGKPTIVFLHGVGIGSSMWKAHLEQFNDYHCLTPDLPGHGQSNNEEWVSLEDTANQIADVIRRQATNGQAHIVGASLGGCVTINLLSVVPDIIDHAFIIGAGVLPLPSAGAMKLILRLLLPFIKTRLILGMLARALNVPQDEWDDFRQAMRATSRQAFLHAFSDALDLRLPRGLEKVTCPTLFIAGEKEQRGTLRSNAILAATMPNGHCRTVADDGHAWMIAAPGLFNGTLRAWIEGESLPEELEDCL